MSHMIRIHPATERRQEFARWAVAQTPKIRTISPTEFAVPAHLFTEAPELLLIGSMVDGHRYISPQEEHQETPGNEAQGPTTAAPPMELEASCENAQEPLPSDLLGVASPAGHTAVEEALKSARSCALSPPTEADEDQAARSTSGSEEEAAPYQCDQCARAFTTARGRDTHRRQIHA